MAVALECHQLVDLHGAELGDAADVVAGEVDEHDVLGDLLRIFAQLGRHAPVVLFGLAPPAGAGDRARHHGRAVHPHHRFGRRAGDRDLGVTQEVHVGARVHLTQDPVEVERVGVHVDIEALREHHLEDVAGDDVLFGHLHGALVLTAGHGRAHRRQIVVGRRRGNGRVGKWATELDGVGADAHRGRVVLVVDLRRRQAEHGNALHHVGPLAPVVEGHERTDDAHHGVGQAELVGGHVVQPFDLAHDVVAEVADDAALQRR